ncbi:hypothetical protein HAX54_030337, partial [Datura stramonium]|nr:hypothetical protein [Datura stramonium]
WNSPALEAAKRRYSQVATSLAQVEIYTIESPIIIGKAQSEAWVWVQDFRSVPIICASQ